MMKKNLRKSSIALAVAAAGVGVVGLSTQAVAVQLADDGLGEALIYPYYTTNNGYKTFVHVVNTSDKAVAFKIRMRDAKNSRDCRDFNVVLSPEDVWTASIEEGGDGQPRIWTRDNSCTSPALPGSDRGGKFVNFTSADYDGRTANGQDSNDTSIDRCREGYVEIIEMGASDGGNFYNDALHNADGVPPCNIIPGDLNSIAGIAAASVEFDEPENVLKGNFSLIRSTTGQGFGGEPTTLANFFSPITQGGFGVDGASASDLLSLAGANLPALNNAQPSISIVDDVTTGTGVFIDQWALAQDAVSAVLMRSSVINEWTSNAAFGANTDWAINFPTKRFYVDPALTGVALAPFSELFNAQGDARSCIDVGIASWNREERTEIVQGGFSPPEVREGSQLCLEANIVTFNRGGSDDGVLDSQYPQNIENSDLGNNGWTRMGLTESLSAQTGITSILSNSPTNQRTFQGLPVTGFAVINRSLAGQAPTNYGTLFDHAYERSALDSGTAN